MANNLFTIDNITIDITEETEKAIYDIVEEQQKEAKERQEAKESLIRLLNDREVIRRLSNLLQMEGFICGNKRGKIDLSLHYGKMKK